MTLKQRLYKLLRWSEKYTKTDMVYVASGGFWSIVGQVSAALIAFLLAIVIARFVPKDIYGEYKYVLAVISIISTFSLTGIGTAVFQAIANGNRGAIRQGFILNLKWSVLVFVGAFLVGAYYLLHNDVSLGISIFFSGCLTPFLTSYNLYNALFAGEKDFRRAAIYGDVITNFIPALGISVVAIVLPTPLALISTYFLTNTVAALYAYHRALTLYKLPKIIEDADSISSYGKHLSAINILSGVAGNIDQILLFHFAGPLDLAIYNFAIAIPNQVKGPLKNLGLMVQARFARQSTVSIRKNIINKMFWLGVVLVAGIAVYIAIAPLIYRLFFPNYIQAVLYSRIFALSLIANIFLPSSSYLIAKKKILEQYLSTVGGSIFQIAALVMGAMLFGIMGVILARVVTRISIMLYTHVLFLKSTNGHKS